MSCHNRKCHYMDNNWSESTAINSTTVFILKCVNKADKVPLTLSPSTGGTAFNVKMVLSLIACIEQNSANKVRINCRLIRYYTRQVHLPMARQVEAQCKGHLKLLYGRILNYLSSGSMYNFKFQLCCATFDYCRKI